MSARFHSTRYVVLAALASLWRNRSMTSGAIATTAIMLITLATFLAINNTLSHILVELGRKSNLIAYVRDDARPSEVTAIIRELRNEPGVGEVNYVSKDDALREFHSRFASQSDLLDLLQSNPLPASVELIVRVSKATL